MTERAYVQCKRCVMDTTDTEITFDDKGFCNHCTQFLEKLKLRSTLLQNDSELNLIVKKIKKDGQHKKYDCILGISGGVDSCYTAFLLKDLGIRTLLVQVDNGWNSEQAVKNIKSVADYLQFDYQSYIIDWEEFRDLQLSFIKASVIDVETPTDISIAGALHLMAAKHNIKHIILGCNPVTEGILPESWHYDSKDKKFITSIQKKFGSIKLKKFYLLGFMQEFYFKFFKRIKITYLLNYFSFSKDEALCLLKSKLNWQNYGGKHHENRFTKFIHSYYIPVKFDMDCRKMMLSCEICNGNISREEALKILIEKPYDEQTLSAQKEFIAKKLKISIQQLDELVALPNKSHTDYPNNEQKLKFIYKVYKKYFAIFLNK